jgi:hypothetical protein
MSNLRNSQLLQQVGRHPLKAALARCFDIAETFQSDVEFLQLDKNLSAEGRENARQSKLRVAIRDLRDAKQPIAEMQKKLEQKRKAVAIPKFDQADVVGFLRRQELRATLRTMDTGQRELTLNDPAFADAMLEQPPVLSGLFWPKISRGPFPRKSRGTATLSPRQKKNGWPACSPRNSPKSPRWRRRSQRRT